MLQAAFGKSVSMHSRVPQMQKLRSSLMRVKSCQFLTFKPGVGQNVALHALSTVKSFLISAFLGHSVSFPNSLQRESVMRLEL